RTGWATVTFGAGGGCGFGFSPQPVRPRKSAAIMTADRVLVITLPVRKSRRGFGLTSGREILPGRGQHPTPVGTLAHLRLGLGRNQILAFPDFPAAPQRAVDSDEARGNVTECHGQRILLVEERRLGGENGREVHRTLLILQRREAKRRPCGGDARR